MRSASFWSFHALRLSWTSCAHHECFIVSCRRAINVCKRPWTVWASCVARSGSKFAVTLIMTTKDLKCARKRSKPPQKEEIAPGISQVFCKLHNPSLRWSHILIWSVLVPQRLPAAKMTTRIRDNCCRADGQLSGKNQESIGPASVHNLSRCVLCVSKNFSSKYPTNSSV